MRSVFSRGGEDLSGEFLAGSFLSPDVQTGVIALDKHHIDELSVDYVEKLSLYEEYSIRVRNLVQNLAEREDIEICDIDCRARTPVDLFGDAVPGLLEAEVIGSDVVPYPEVVPSVEAIPDLVTVRVLLRFSEDVPKVEEIICSEFDVDPDVSMPSAVLEDPFRFGYPAAFYVLSLSEGRSSSPEWRKYKNLSFKLEIRSLLQETWAIISRRLNSQPVSISENKYKRKLFRLAAILEEADEGFLSLRSEAQSVSLTDGYASPRPGASIAAQRTYTEEELYAFFNSEQSAAIDKWGTTVVEAGFRIFVPTPNYMKESFDYLFKIFRAAGIDTIDEVRKFLADLDAGNKGLAQLRSVRDTFEKESASWRVDAFSALFLLVLNLKWDVLKTKDLTKLGIKAGSDRISGVEA
ncbi:MAG: hypothetical protein LBR38_07595 [Synergistaceae bacterium]|jgi:hypothetical protein|nr:hypothetical protein [Synergistaceae bacterium]